MSDFKWIQVDFQQFINQFGKDLIIENAPVILYSKKDKEHEAYNSLIAFFLITGGLFIFIALTYFLSSVFFNLIIFTFIMIIGTIADTLLLINVIKSNVYIKLLECWVEIHRSVAQSDFEYYCFTYYPIFTGKCHPNEAKNVIFKLYLEQVIKSKIDITQIEVYFKINQLDHSITEKIGFFFQYTEGKQFQDENINHATWKFFPYKKSNNENFIAIGNWDHQFEWRDDLELDFDKLHEYAPWVIKRWNDTNLKPLTHEYKEKINWNLWYIESRPKLKPWEGNLEDQAYENPMMFKDLEIVNEAIKKIIGKEQEVERIRDIKENLFMFKSYFRDLGS
ncbi:hypothetical protein LCGC14_2076260 [marine sediment metagenome]|uniref:Uncharacterized protein n=1 Tax=marine sediment metagenome TaxID=412755 RepID=A0A0F9EGV7_9ZZZZ